MLIDDRSRLAAILQAVADALDIPDHVYEDATLKYEDVGDHLSADDSSLRAYNPNIYVQGSFRLGTVVRPYGHEDDYDIDLVCQLEIRKESITQEDLKAKVGTRLKARDDLAKILKPSRRCWMLDYPAEAGKPAFHMDVLPAIPNLERRPSGLLITDTELIRWQKSNPVAFSEWFKKRMEVVFVARRAAVAESLAASIEEVPDWRVKTPLQRCVQILKRHRDVYFVKSPDIRPVSIVITTLAAHAYNNEADIYDALTGIVGRMHHFIEYRNGSWWVQNPVDDGENFADRWNEYPERRQAFGRWLQKVGADINLLSRAANTNDGLAILRGLLGRQAIDRVAARFASADAGTYPLSVTPQPAVPALADHRHAMPPAWPMVPRYNVKVAKAVFKKKGAKRLWTFGDSTVPKGVWIRFSAQTDAPGPYRIEWQIVNTGTEAINAGQPRGEFQSSEPDASGVRWESTSYSGTHWVEAFVINPSGTCIARSGRVFVKVR
jgi:hypothetical protein